MTQGCFFRLGVAAVDDVTSSSAVRTGDFGRRTVGEERSWSVTWKRSIKEGGISLTMLSCSGGFELAYLEETAFTKVVIVAGEINHLF